MDSTVESKAFCPCMHQHRHLSSLPYSQHHHHHFHVLPHCPFHGNMILHSMNHSPVCPLFNFYPRLLDDQPNESKQLVSGTQENVEAEQEEEEDPVFVLTDEWAEFFAKSEAKRRQEKKQAKRKGKKQMADSVSHQ